MSNVKGSGVLAVYEYLRQQFGDEGMEKLKNALNEDDRKTFTKPLLASFWVDYGFYMRMILTADKVLGAGDYKVVENAARYNMRKNFQGIYKMFVSLATPAFILGKAPLVWRQWFDGGRLETDRPSEKSTRLRLYEFSDMPPKHEYNLTPSMDEILKISGGKKTRVVHTKCVLKGDDHCLWECTWE